MPADLTAARRALATYDRLSVMGDRESRIRLATTSEFDRHLRTAFAAVDALEAERDTYHALLVRVAVVMSELDAAADWHEFDSLRDVIREALSYNPATGREE